MSQRTFCVIKNGRPVERYLSEAQAEAYAKLMAEGLESHRAGSKIHVPEFEIAHDRRVEERMNLILKEGKPYAFIQNPHGGDRG